MTEGALNKSTYEKLGLQCWKSGFMDCDASLAMTERRLAMTENIIIPVFMGAIENSHSFFAIFISILLSICSFDGVGT
jgi:hypothetical protein